MWNIKPTPVLAGLCLMALALPAIASNGADSTETVVVLGTLNGASACKDETPEHARGLAEKAWQDGAYQRAGECYIVAGDHALANEAFVRASAQSSGDTSRRLASNLNDVKAQARQMKQAFQRR